MMTIIGITGRAGSGKTTFQEILCTRFDIHCIDLDKVGHELLETNDVKLSLFTLFGPLVFTNKKVDRKKLGAIVFQDSESLDMLNKLMHPLIKKCVITMIASAQKPIIIVGALIQEIGLTHVCDEVWCIDASDEEIYAHSPQKKHILTVQRTRESYCNEAHHIIRNPFSTPWELEASIVALLSDYAIEKEDF